MFGNRCFHVFAFTVLVLGFQAFAGAKELGVNLDYANDWSRSLMFADAMKQARPWGTVNNANDNSVTVDADGWPTQDASVIVITTIPTAPPAPYIAGTYKLSFIGTAQVSSGGPVVTVTNLVYDQISNTTTADVVAAESATGIVLIFRGTHGGVRNVKLMRPIAYNSTESHSQNETFSRAFLQRLAPFSVIRFLDYNRAGASGEHEWQDRTLPTHATQQGRQLGPHNSWTGGAWEYAIQLCNETQKDMWINIPGPASNDYVLQLATLIHNNLAPGRNLYFEWADEVWNWTYGYFETPDNFNAAGAEVNAGNSPLNYDGSTNQGYWAWRRMAKRMKEFSDIFRSVYGDSQMMTTVRPMLAVQLANPSILREELLFVENVYGPPKNFFYGVAGAPYLNLRPPMNSATNLTVDDIFGPNGISVTLDTVKAADLEETNWALAYGLKNLAYESSTELDGTASLDAKIAAERDPRMGQMYIENITNWFANGGGLALYYRLTGPYNEFGSAGLTENVYRTTYKTAAIDTVAAMPDIPIVAGSVPPVTLSGGRFGAQSGWESSGDSPVSLTPGTWFSYLIRVDQDGIYQLGATVSAASSGQIEALVDGVSIGTGSFQNVRQQGMWQTLPNAYVQLTTGLHSIRLRSVSGNFFLNTFSVISVN
jgi:hypothetical protein